MQIYVSSGKRKSYADELTATHTINSILTASKLQFGSLVAAEIAAHLSWA